MIAPGSSHTEARPEVSRTRITAGFLLVASLSLGSYYLWLYSSCLDRFFFLDDYWVLREAEDISIQSPIDIWKFLRPVPFFLLYRPISTVVYFYTIRQLFGPDPTAYHAIQLAFNIFNSVLVCGIATLLFRSRPLGLATAFAYAAAPGHALASCWNASFTMTGTAFFYFLGLLVWLRMRSRWRTPITATLFVMALLASEHAITFPVSLTLVACLAQQERDWRRLMRQQGVFYVIAAVYGCIKLTYIRLLFAGIITGPAAFPALLAAQTKYAVRFDPWLLLHNVGYYLDYAWSPLYAGGLSRAWPLASGAFFFGVAVATTALVIVRRCTAVSLRVATLGIDLFVVALGPVLLLRGHLVFYYVGIAALGTSLAVVGLARAVPRVSTVAVGMVVVILVLTNALSSASLVRRREEFWMFDHHTEYAETWVYAITQGIRGRRVEEVVVPRNVFTEYLLEQGQAHRTLACARYRVRLSTQIEAEDVKAGSVVIRRPQRVPPAATRGERWSWLRTACAAERDRPQE